MKKIILSFDDSRWDTYEYAFPVLKKYNLVATINAISDNVLNLDCKDKEYDSWVGSMSLNELMICQQYGIEIASHSQKHNNDVAEIDKSIQELKKRGIDICGFASPFSFITEQNDCGIGALLDKGILRYVRSGIQVRREGRIYSILSYIERKSHSKKLFYYLNKRCIIRKPTKFIYAVSITCYTTVNQIMHFIEKMKDDEAVVLCFHSILPNDDIHTATGTWRWDVDAFLELCERLKTDENIVVCRTRDLFEVI